jgi:hypothetical protein
VISTVIPVAYDYLYAFGAIARVYDISDEIILGLDVDRISWSKGAFEFNLEEFQTEIKKLDHSGKIRLIEENFHTEEHPMANDTRERNILSSYCKPGNWVLQIDSDEYMLNPADFKKWLSTADPECDVQAQWITVFKSFGDRVLVAHEPGHQVHVGTRLRSSYNYCRKTERPARLSNLQILHFSWGRSRKDLAQKLVNWSHSKDFDTNKFLEFWDGINLSNFQSVRNFHPLHPPLWSKLSAITLPPTLRIAA